MSQENELSLEKLRISERLGKVEAHMEGMSEKMQSFINVQNKTSVDLQAMLEKHDDEIYGEKDFPGLKQSVRGLKESDAKREWHTRALFGGVLSLAGKFIYDFFHHS